MAAGFIDMVTKKYPVRGSSGAGHSRVSGEKEVPIQIMVSENVRRQVALMGANRGENIRTVVLRGLCAIGIDIPESELADRRGRRRSGNGGSDGAQ